MDAPESTASRSNSIRSPSPSCAVRDVSRSICMLGVRLTRPDRRCGWHGLLTAADQAPEIPGAGANSIRPSLGVRPTLRDNVADDSIGR